MRSHKEDNGEGHVSPYLDWKGMSKIEGNDKAELIKEKARMIEESAVRQERLLKVAPGSVKEENKVNDLLINAIEAKLAILDEI